MALSFNPASSQSGNLGVVNYGTDIITVSHWIWVADSTFYIILCSSVDFLVTPHCWGIYYGSGNAVGSFQGASGYREERLTMPPAGAWHHAALIFDNSTTAGDVRIFLNGVEGSGAIAFDTKTGSGPFATQSLDLAWWQRAGAGGNYFNGRLAELALYSGALAPADIVSLAKGRRPIGVRPERLLHYWPLLTTTSPDVRRGNTLTSNATLTDHPRVY